MAPLAALAVVIYLSIVRTEEEKGLFVILTLELVFLKTIIPFCVRTSDFLFCSQSGTFEEDLVGAMGSPWALRSFLVGRVLLFLQPP